MIQGFTLEIASYSSKPEVIFLFKDGGCSPLVDVKAINSEFTNDSLLLMAKRDGFIGSGFHSDIIQFITLHNSEGIMNCNIDKNWQREKIYIDGVSNYISMVVPPCEKGLFQLSPIL